MTPHTKAGRALLDALMDLADSARVYDLPAARQSYIDLIHRIENDAPAALDVEQLREMVGRDHPHDGYGECGACQAYRLLEEYLARLSGTTERES